MPSSFQDSLFCFFSGFSHQDATVVEYSEDADLKVVTLHCINTGKRHVLTGDYIQLDGVLFEVIEVGDDQFKARSTFELVEDTTLKALPPGSRLILSVLAENDLTHEQLWMLQPSAFGKICYQGYRVQPGHQHTLELQFEAPKSMAAIIKEDSHLGLNGASLTARNVSIDGEVIKFSIYAGRETRESSPFNETLEPGTMINLTEAADVIATSMYCA